MKSATKTELVKVPHSLHEFYRMLRPNKHDADSIPEFAPYQVDIWNDRFKAHRTRYYVRSPGVGISSILLMEVLNVVLSSERRVDALVLVSDQFEAQRRRDELVEMIKESVYADCLVPNGEDVESISTLAMFHRTGIAIRAPHDRSDSQVRSILVSSIVGFSASSVNVDHVLVLDVMESDYPREMISCGMANAIPTRMLRDGKMVVAMIPRAPFYGLIERIPEINDLEPGALLKAGDNLVRRIPMSIAIDEGVIRGRQESKLEMRLMDKAIRGAIYPTESKGNI